MSAVTHTPWSYRDSVTRITTKLVTLIAIFLLVTGWNQKEMAYLTPEHGIGYWLGIVGGSMMLTLALYPLRKHLAVMRHLGAVRHWFRMHMLFGVFGPIAILYHCNFSLGAMNSNIALWSMVVVASSGLLGRYFYSHIHKGLYGREISLNELKKNWEEKKSSIDDVSEIEILENYLLDYEKRIAFPDKRLGTAFFKTLAYPFKRWGFNRRIRYLKKHKEFVVDPAHMDILRDRLATAATVYRHMTFERLFTLWHLFHMPLFFMLIIAGIAHVIAVHMY